MGGDTRNDLRNVVMGDRNLLLPGSTRLCKLLTWKKKGAKKNNNKAKKEILWKH